jgi:N-acetylglucosaminyldiphosphoundecaprenol N-acetyl-beta-D-mannosaminyltransferase
MIVLDKYLVERSYDESKRGHMHMEATADKAEVYKHSVARRVEVLGVFIDNLTMNQVIMRIAGIVEAGRFAYGVTPNVDHLIRLRRDAEFRKSYGSAELIVPDGVPLLWASRLLGRPLRERINGTDLFEATCEMAARRGFSIYLLGGSPGTAESARDRLREKYPELNVAGCCCPPHGFHEDEAQNQVIQDAICRSGADILFVGLGAPKQENWMYSYAKGSGAPFALGVGVSFSFVGGEIARAPVWMQRHGFEWLWRLAHEPRRLWKRYLVDDMVFLMILASAVFRKTYRNTLGNGRDERTPFA